MAPGDDHGYDFPFEEAVGHDDHLVPVLKLNKYFKPDYFTVVVPVVVVLLTALPLVVISSRCRPSPTASPWRARIAE
ncbi:hypothetical protein ACLOAV_008986 [Pseudogymnoascus australis]